MKAKSKKRKKSKDQPPPSSPIPPELKKLVPDHPDISFFREAPPINISLELYVLCPKIN